MGTGGSSLPSSPLWSYIYVIPDVYIFLSIGSFQPLSQGFQLTVFVYQKTNNYIANEKQIFLHIIFYCVLVKIIEFFVKRVRKIQVFLSFLEIKPSTY